MQTKRKKSGDSEKDVKIQRELKARANYSLVILGQAFERHGSGSYLNLIPPSKRGREGA